MRRPRSSQERFAATQRNMTPGAAGGRTPLVSPEPRPLDPPKTLGLDAYDVLLPWGIAGDAVDLTNPDPLSGAAAPSVVDGAWHGIYSDAAAAAAGSGPSIQFGVDAKTGFLLRSDTQEATYADWLAFWLDTGDGTANLDMYAIGGARLKATLTNITSLTGDGYDATPTYLGHWEMWAGPETSHMRVSSNGYEAWANVDGHQRIGNVHVEGPIAYIGMKVIENVLTTNHFSWLDLLESTGDVGGSANHANVFAKDNGSGKTQLCVSFGGGTVVLATEP